MSSTMTEAMFKAGLIDKKHESEKQKAVTGKLAVEAFRKATPDEPMFANISVYKEDVRRHNEKRLEWKGIVACTGVKTVNIEDDYGIYSDRHASFRAIEDGEMINDVPYGFHPKRSVGFYGDADNFVVNEYLETTPELKEQYASCIDDIKVTVSYADYTDAKPDKYLKGHLSADVIKGTEVTKEVISGAHSLNDAEIWMLKNHPGQLQGFSASTTSGDFRMTAIPSSHNYPDGQFETRKGRELYAAERAKELGVELGKFDYSKADVIINKQHDLQLETEQLTSGLSNAQNSDLSLENK